MGSDDTETDLTKAYPWALRVERFDDGGMLPILREAYARAQGLEVASRVLGWSLSRVYWKPGLWLTEPDLLEWRSPLVPYPLLVIRGGAGALCGYVGVPRSHPLHGREEGGQGLTESINWGLPSGGGPLFVPTGTSAGCWWLGFDCGHMQFLPAVHNPDRGPHIPTAEAYVDVPTIRQRVEDLALTLHAMTLPKS